MAIPEARWKSAINLALVALTLSGFGAFFKIYGGTKYNSKALFVDGLTCIAGLFAGASLIWWLKKASKPPDKDHPYGHERFAFGGVIYAIVIYSVVAGFIISRLIRPGSYVVSSMAPLFALAGIAFYSLAIAIYRKVEIAGIPMSVFTFSEILEGLISAIASFLGSIRGYIIDYVGAWVIGSYLLIELFLQTRELILSISDRVPERLRETLKEELEKTGFKVLSLRVRSIIPDRYHGDAVVELPEALSYEEADEIIDALVNRFKDRGIDLIVHIEARRKIGNNDELRASEYTYEEGVLD